MRRLPPLRAAPLVLLLALACWCGRLSPSGAAGAELDVDADLDGALVSGEAPLARDVEESDAAAPVDELFPQVHLRPPLNWINDPNGMFFFRGRYHVFAQYNPFGATWGNMSWHHSVSVDLVHWRHVGVALWPDQPYDVQGVFSGSATLVDGVPILAYTGISSAGLETLNLARPRNLSDPDLAQWDKFEANPVIAVSAAQQGRDPTTAWLDASTGRYLLAYGSGSEHGAGTGPGQALLLLSGAPGEMWVANWTLLPRPLHANDVAQFWECPDLIVMRERAGADACGPSGTGQPDSEELAGIPALLKVSLMTTRQDYFAMGRYDPAARVWTPGCAPSECDSADAGGQAHADVGFQSQLIDGGSFYASKSFFDPVSGEQVLLGWAAEEDASSNWVARGWAGLHSLPRRMWPSSTGNRVCQGVLQALEAMRTQARCFDDSAADLMQPAPAGHIPPLEGVWGNQQELDMEFLLQPDDDDADGDAAHVGPHAAAADAPADPSPAEPSPVIRMQRFGVSVLSSADGSMATQVGFLLLSPPGAEEWMPSFDLPGMDYSIAAHATTPAACQAACQADRARCKAWTMVLSGPEANADEAVERSSSSSAPPPPPYCTLKDSVPLPVQLPSASSPSSPRLVSGVLVPDVSDPVAYLGHCAQSAAPAAARRRAHAPGPAAPAAAPPAAAPPASSSGPIAPRTVWLFMNRSASSSASDGGASRATSSMPFVLDPLSPDLGVDARTGAPVWRLGLRVWVDHSVVEAFEMTGRAAILARVYPDAAAQHTRLFQHGFPTPDATHASARSSVGVHSVAAVPSAVQLNWLTVWNLTSIYEHTSEAPRSAQEAAHPDWEHLSVLE